MHLSKGILISKFTLNFNYFIWMIAAFVLTSLIFIVLVIVIIICSSFRSKHKAFQNGSSLQKSRDIFIIEKCESNKSIAFDKSNEVISSLKKSDGMVKKNHCMCCFKSKTCSLIQLSEESFVLLDKEGEIMNIEIRDKDVEDDNMLFMTASMTDGKNQYENGRVGRIERELPPLPLGKSLPKSSSRDNDLVVGDIFSTPLSGSFMCNNKPKDNSCNNSLCDKISNHQFPVIIPKYEITPRLCVECCSVINVDIPSTDDVSSVEYDPTYAAIRMAKVSCPVCGAPSVYTPFHSNRNSNLSLHFNSGLGSPTRYPKDSVNNSTYTSIAKLAKDVPQKIDRCDQDVKSRCSTIKRQRSISQGDIILGRLEKNSKMQKSDTRCDSLHIEISQPGEKTPVVIPRPGSMSLWNLRASNRNSPYYMYPIIPERAYGQSVVDLVEKLRATENYELQDLIQSATHGLILGDSFKMGGSLTNFKAKRWPPDPYHKICGSSFTRSAFCSPLKVFDEDFRFCSQQYNFSDTFDSTSLNPGSSYRNCLSFQSIIIPPISLKDCGILNTLNIKESKKNKQPTFDSENINNTLIEDMVLVYENLDSEGVEVHQGLELLNYSDENNYEHLQDSLHLSHPDILCNELYSEKFFSYDNRQGNETLLSVQHRPISIFLCENEIIRKEKLFNFGLENLEVRGASSVQMSPLMEQSLENSSSKTTISSLSYHQLFQKIISSEECCGKSPSSIETNASIDKLNGLSPIDHDFIFKDFLWTNLNSAFDDYDTFE